MRVPKRSPGPDARLSVTEHPVQRDRHLGALAAPVLEGDHVNGAGYIGIAADGREDCAAGDVRSLADRSSEGREPAVDVLPSDAFGR